MGNANLSGWGWTGECSFYPFAIDAGSNAEKLMHSCNIHNEWGLKSENEWGL